MSYISNRDGIVRTGETVDNLLTKIEDLDKVSKYEDGIMSKEDKRKLDEDVADEELSIEEIANILNF